MKAQNSNKYVKSFITYLLFGILWFPILSFSQATYKLDKTTRFDKLGSNEGLSTDYTHGIHQDKYGFIWIGTQFGLNMYDGRQLKIFTAKQNDKQSPDLSTYSTIKN